MIKGAAILFETDSEKFCNRAIMVNAPLETRIERVVKRDGLLAEEVQRRNSKQFSEEKKAAWPIIL